VTGAFGVLIKRDVIAAKEVGEMEWMKEEGQGQETPRSFWKENSSRKLSRTHPFPALEISEKQIGEVNRRTTHPQHTRT
jgi:hypothetical protein